jgi:dTDP-4-amino-4,6-dideoxygalactose transaminase
MPYFVGRPSVFDQREFQSYVDDIFTLGVLTNNGKYVQLLEKKAGEVSGAAHVVALSNATLAL